VGALNPNDTIALFSNDGPWVGYFRNGAALVSTFPVTFNASRLPSNAIVMPNGEVRAALDPDDFYSGFGVWSGTSFSAPVLAGELAERLAHAYYETGDTEQSAKAAVTRMQDLISALPGRLTRKLEEPPR
jgi:subtilisin family serine protease